MHMPNKARCPVWCYSYTEIRFIFTRPCYRAHIRLLASLNVAIRRHSTVHCIIGFSVTACRTRLQFWPTPRDPLNQSKSHLAHWFIVLYRTRKLPKFIHVAQGIESSLCEIVGSHGFSVIFCILWNVYAHAQVIVSSVGAVCCTKVSFRDFDNMTALWGSSCH